jgi:hypothetical protein
MQPVDLQQADRERAAALQVDRSFIVQCRRVRARPDC